MPRINITQQDGSIVAETTKEGIERHLLERNPKLYRATCLSLFGDTELGHQLGPFGTPPLATQILEGTFQHEEKAINAIVAQLQRRTDITPMPQPILTERDFSNAFKGIWEASSSSPAGLYNALYKYLV
jgi:hypothetical protein